MGRKGKQELGAVTASLQRGDGVMGRMGPMRQIGLMGRIDLDGLGGARGLARKEMGK